MTQRLVEEKGEVENILRSNYREEYRIAFEAWTFLSRILRMRASLSSLSGLSLSQRYKNCTPFYLTCHWHYSTWDNINMVNHRKGNCIQLL